MILDLFYLELIKFVKEESELESDLEGWLTPLYLRRPIFEKLFNIAEYSKLSKEEKEMYDASLKYKWDDKVVSRKPFRQYEMAFFVRRAWRSIIGASPEPTLQQKGLAKSRRVAGDCESGGRCTAVHGLWE